MITREKIEKLCEALRECQIQIGVRIPGCENSGVYILSPHIEEMDCQVSNLKVLYSPIYPGYSLVFSKKIKLDWKIWKMTRIFEEISQMLLED